MSRMAATTSSTDESLLERAHNRDTEALRALIERHLHPAWRIATVVAPRPELAEAAVVEGFCNGLQAAHRYPDAVPALRARIVTATRRAAALAGDGEGPVSPAGDLVVDAFRTLPEKWRTALWLTEVEGGRSDQVARLLGIDRSTAAALAGRAAAGLRQRLATDAAGRAADVECRDILSELPAHAAGRLTPAEQDRVGVHLASCRSCAAWLAALVSPRPALRRLIHPPPATLAPAIAARWSELVEHERRGVGWLTPFTERAVGAAAAAVLAIGLGGAVLLRGDHGDEGGRRERARPAAPPDAGASTGESALGSLIERQLLGDSSLPSCARNTASSWGRLRTLATSKTPAATPSAGVDAASRSSGGATTAMPTAPPPTTAPRQDLSSPTAAPAIPSLPAPSQSAPSPAPTIPSLPPEPQPSPSPAVPSTPPLPPTDTGSGTQVGGNVGDGTATVGVGDCTGGTVLDVSLGCTPPPSDQIVTVQVPGIG